MGEIATQLRFDGFMLDLANRQLLRDGRTIDLGSRYFDALVLLACSSGTLVSKDRFMDEVWKGIPVTDEALTQCIRSLRRALGDEAGKPRFIETVPKHGYRFVAAVESVQAEVRATPKLQSHAEGLAGATTLGALSAGLAGGLLYGVLGTTGNAAGVATLVLLAAALAVLGGAGIGAGMALGAHLRGERDWALVLGGTAGGILVGAVGSALAVHGMYSLTGVDPGRVTGMFEGGALGASASAGVVMAFRNELRMAAACAVAALIGAFACGATALAGGHLLGATLALLETGFPSSQLAMNRIGPLFGETRFGATTHLGTTVLEGAIFASAITCANLIWRRRRI